MMTESQQENTTRLAIAQSLAEALLESGQLSEVEAGLQSNGLHLNLPPNPSLEQASSSLASLLERNPELVPVEKWNQLPEDRQVEWGTEQLNLAGAGSGE